MPYALATGLIVLGCLVVRHINGRRAPLWIALLAILLVLGSISEVRWRLMEHRYTTATATLLDRPDAHVVCERLSGAMFNVWNRSGYVQYRQDGKKPSRADLTFDTCQDLRSWETHGKHANQRDQIIAVHVLTHEAMHVAGYYNEAQAECAAMQHDSAMAQVLGASKTDADALAAYYFKYVYPHLRDDYLSDGCRADGPMDATPGDGLWP